MPRVGAVLERASRIVLVASILIAGVVHAWLASGRPWLASAAAAAFAITFVLARVSLRAALVPVLAAAYIAPALTLVGFAASDYHTTLVWLAALAGPILAHVDLSRWHIPGRWTIPFAAWALIIAVSWPIVAGRELDFSLVALRTYDTTNAAFAAPPRLAAAWILIVALGQMIGILWVDLLWARFAGDKLPDAERFVILPLLASVVIGALAGLYQGLVDVQWLNLAFWARLEGRVGGLMLDANTFGIGAAMWAPAAVALAWRFGRGLWLGVLTYLLLAAAMWYSGSRTALLACGVGTAGLLVALAERRGVWQPRMVPIALGAGAALFVIVLAVAPRGGQSSSPLQRVFDRLPRLEAAEFVRFADEILWTRFGYGKAAAAIATEHPLTGVGIGAFHIVSTDYLYRDFGARRDSDNAQNWWRHQIAELGVLGALPSLWISVLVVGLLWRRDSDINPRGVTAVLRGVLIGVGIASVLGVPTQHPASWVSFVTLMFWLTALRTPAAMPSRPASGAWWIAAFALAGTTATGQLITANGDLRVAERALRSRLPYHYGLSAPEGLSEYGELRWAAARAVLVTAVPHRWLQLTLFAPSADIASHPLGVELSLTGRRVMQHALATREPVTFFVEMPEGMDWVLLELNATREVRPGQALQAATQWLPELPRNAPSDRVVR